MLPVGPAPPVGEGEALPSVTPLDAGPGDELCGPADEAGEEATGSDDRVGAVVGTPVGGAGGAVRWPPGPAPEVVPRLPPPPDAPTPPVAARDRVTGAPRRGPALPGPALGDCAASVLSAGTMS
ncbi:hypothetical protein ACFFWC_10875 [Plantactinospora siamensis]|uniref:Uncharacterized protein n=1 Tax=Plantactinospora siamensis TaxID=555372 RepID=A0ABV6P0A6_9ACTN